jgi:hypothetical protein
VRNAGLRVRREVRGGYLFDAAALTTYTLCSLALTDHADEHHVGCGRLGENDKGS